MSFPRTAALVMVGAIAVSLGGKASAAGLNDTGQALCYSTSGAVVPCKGGQDGRYGRDAAAAVGALVKVGAGAAGFDYTKIANNGSVLPDTALLGTGATDWACTRDNVTGLTWEVKTASNTTLRSEAHTYTWYSTVSNGGVPGTLGSNTCNGTLAAYSNQCNTTNYVLAVNAAGLCGQSDWRLPRNLELLSLAHYGSEDSAAIDIAYFPNTTGVPYWSSTNWAANSIAAWYASFNIGVASATKSFAFRVRVVRGP